MNEHGLFVVRAKDLVRFLWNNGNIGQLYYLDRPNIKRVSHLEKNKLHVVKTQLVELELEHRDLDDAITRFSQDPDPDQLQLKRMKKRKLKLKDQITQLRSHLIPDMDA